MKKPLLLAVLSGTLCLQGLLAQDPGFLPAAPRSPASAPPAIGPSSGAASPAAASDDTAASASRILSMENLDDTRPLNIGDLVSLRIVEDRDRVISLYVQDSGDLQAPYIGLVKAAGKTCKQIAFGMKQQLERQYFQKATVIIALERAVRTRFGPGMMPDDMGYITIYGQVGRQGRYEFAPEEELTVSQAVLRAGGFSQFANTKKVKVIRKVPGKGNVTIIVNLHEIMTKGRLEKDIPIRPNDVIIVDEKLVNF